MAWHMLALIGIDMMPKLDNNYVVFSCIIDT